VQGSEPRDLTLLADILREFVRQVGEGPPPRYLYVPPGGTVSLADDIRWLLTANDEASAWLAGMVMVERPDVVRLGFSALLLRDPLQAN